MIEIQRVLTDNSPMSEGYTLEGLNRLKKAYQRGVIKIREGDSWLEFDSMKAMRAAINDIEIEIAKQKGSSGVNNNNPIGTKRVRFL